MRQIKLLLILFLLFICCLRSQAQYKAKYIQDKTIDWGIHISPLVYGTKGYAAGAGFSKPLGPKMMGHITAAYIYMGYLNGEFMRSDGLELTPRILFFPDRVVNHKGFVYGFEVPVSYHTIKDGKWKSYQTLGGVVPVSYQRYEHIKAKMFQTGLGFQTGLRTHKRNSRAFWQPTLTLGLLYQKLSDYTETEELDAFMSQKSGLGLYFKLEVAIGFYKFKKKTVSVLSL